jgi:hypothetical protein
MGDVDAATAALDELERLEPFAYLPGEQALGPAWTAAVTGSLPLARELLLDGAGALEESGHHAMEAWLLHDACRLGHRGTSERLAALADLCEGDLVPAWAEHAAALDEDRATGLVAATDSFERIGAPRPRCAPPPRD